jgi:hypothetical protein
MCGEGNGLVERILHVTSLFSDSTISCFYFVALVKLLKIHKSESLVDAEYGIVEYNQKISTGPGL